MQYGVIALTAAAQVAVAVVLMVTYNRLLTILYLTVAPLYAGGLAMHWSCGS